MLKLLLAAIVVYLVNQIHFPTELGVKGLNVANLMFLLALLMLPRRLPREQEPPMLKGALLGFFAVLVIAFAVAQLVRPGNLLADVTYLKNAVFYPLFYFLFLAAVRDMRTVKFLLFMVLLVAAVASLEAIREALDYGIGTFAENHRSAGPFGMDYRSANRAGVYYAMFLPLFFSVALNLRNRKWVRLLALGGALLTAAAVVFTYSRQSYFIALAGIAILLMRRGVFTALLLGTVIAYSITLLPSGVTERVEQTQQTGDYGQEELDPSTASRFEIWKGAVSMWSEQPWGIGLDRFKQEIGNYSGFKHFDAHNFYVLTLAECGIQGLVALLVLAAALLRLARRARRQALDAESRTLAWGFSVCTICMLLGNLYGSPFLEGSVMGDYWILCALTERYFRLRRAERESAPAVAVPTPADHTPVPA
ncbi:O-antigen polymerase [Mizugakiibacter sediminis]|uniref:O-antigen polymerase n=1 Tax=Mizugakiibacter sediminis TaxID=1475481 RepID=A0A0K8QN84_9GAMM|nr:O-antigen ligase family protein [Mizugakiibacter sediminis]GAP66370.1 O-antigen polymerase [Mizugakiibacter sediminis]